MIFPVRILLKLTLILAISSQGLAQTPPNMCSLPISTYVPNSAVIGKLLTTIMNIDQQTCHSLCSSISQCMITQFTDARWNYGYGYYGDSGSAYNKAPIIRNSNNGSEPDHDTTPPRSNNTVWSTTQNPNSDPNTTTPHPDFWTTTRSQNSNQPTTSSQPHNVSWTTTAYGINGSTTNGYSYRFVPAQCDLFKSVSSVLFNGNIVTSTQFSAAYANNAIKTLGCKLYRNTFYWGIKDWKNVNNVANANLCAITCALNVECKTWAFFSPPSCNSNSNSNYTNVYQQYYYMQPSCLTSNTAIGLTTNSTNNLPIGMTTGVCSKPLLSS